MRDKEIDILKGIGIVLVLVAHSLSGYVDTFAASFHMPLFFLVSGYFCRKRPVGIAIKADFKRLGLPFFFAVGVMVIGALLLSPFECEEIITPRYALEALAYGNGSPGNYGKIWGNWAVVGSIWFLAALFWSKTMFNILLNIGERYVVLMSLVLGGIGVLLCKYILLPYSFLQGMSALPFMLIGYEANRIGGMKSVLGKVRSSWRMTLFASIMVACWMVSTFFKSINMADCSYSLYYYPNIILATSGTFCMYCLSCQMARRTVWLAKVLAFLGKYSIILVCFPVLESFLIPLNSIIPEMPYRVIAILTCKVFWCAFAFVVVFNVGWLRRLFGVVLDERRETRGLRRESRDERP